MKMYILFGVLCICLLIAYWRITPHHEVITKKILFSGDKWPDEWEQVGLPTPYSGFLIVQHSGDSAELSLNLASGSNLIMMQGNLSQQGEAQFLRITKIESDGPLSAPVHALLILLNSHLDTDVLVDVVLWKSVIKTLLSASSSTHGTWLGHIRYQILETSINKKGRSTAPASPLKFVPLSALL